MTWHDSTCPACGQRDRQILLGARNATLGAQVVADSWASPFNDDKKLIAFSDSVQDAAHRAGFFGARTYTNTVRTAMARAIDELVRPSLPWDAFLQRFEQLWRQPGSPLYMDRERFVAEFIAPNMTWQRDWAQELLVHGALAGFQPAARARTKTAGLAGGGRVHLPEPPRAQSGAHRQSSARTAHGAGRAGGPAAHTAAARVLGAVGTL